MTVKVANFVSGIDYLGFTYTARRRASFGRTREGRGDDFSLSGNPAPLCRPMVRLIGVRVDVLTKIDSPFLLRLFAPAWYYDFRQNLCPAREVQSPKATAGKVLMGVDI
jgi:hypothetical protein